jgi:DNA-binding winged helix-turn-helix (wHTH) protein/TolB-like protein
MDASALTPTIDLAAEMPFRVGGANVDPVSREATFEGGSERLQPQNLKVLIALVRAKGSVVTREQLVDLCWEGRFVGDDVINRSISMLRQFATRAGGFAIETVPRAGYRLVEEKRQGKSNWRRWAPIAAVLIIAIAMAAWLLIGRGGNSASDRTPTIALIPFTTASTDPATRQLATAIHDSVAHTLFQTQFHVRQVGEAGAAADADFVISGDLGSAQGKVIATVRMEETAHHTIVYSDRFEASPQQSAALIDQIGGQVAGSIGWTVPLLMLDREHRTDPAVTAQIFRKVDLMRFDGLNLYESARRLAAQVPDSVLAQMTYAFGTAFALPDLPRDQRAEAVAAGRQAQQRARELAPRAGEPFIGWCLLHSTVRSVECEDNLRLAMRIDPDAPSVDWFLADRIKDFGRYTDSLDLARQSLAHDQFVPGKIALTLRMLDATGRSAEADQYYRQTRRWWPNYENLVWSRVSGMIDAGDYAAIERFEREVGRSAWPMGYEPLAPIAAAARSNSLSGARSACPVPGADTLKTIFCMTVLAKLGDADSAFAIADKLYPNRIGRTAADEDRIWFDRPFVNGTEYLTGPGAAALRRDPRFLPLAERTGLLLYWRRGRLPDFCGLPRPEPICARLR